jgi:D-alanyl-D-alanine carboxypeptidase
MRNYNTLIDRYPGADGMKTGFICASGFNLVASATRDGRRLIAVVLGAPSSPVRAVKAAQLLERGFNGSSLSWLIPSLGTVDALAPVAAAPPNLREEMCGKHRRRPAAEEADADEDDEIAGADAASGSQLALSLNSTRSPTARGADLLAPGGGTPSRIVVVQLGPTKKQAGPQLAAAGPMRLPASRPEPAPDSAPANGQAVAPAAKSWSTFSPVALAATPPASLAVRPAKPVPPLPRPRPKGKS